MSAPSALPLRDETVMLPGYWPVVRRAPVDRVAVLPLVTLAEELGSDAEK